MVDECIHLTYHLIHMAVTNNLLVVADHEGKKFQLHPWHCPVCKSSEEKVLGLRGGKSHRYKLGAETTIVQCETCNLLYPNPFPIPVSMQEIYGDVEKYFILHDAQMKIDACQTVIREAKKILGKNKIAVLDVGAGRGEFVHAANLENCAAVGLELSNAMINYAKETYQIQLQAESIEDHAKNKSACYDFITLNAVLEHVYDPDAMIAASSKLLLAGGLIFLDIPNEPNLLTRVGNLWNRICGSEAVYNLSPTWSPYHVYGFNSKALKIILEKHNIEIIKMKIFSDPRIYSSTSSWKDQLKSFVATQVNRFANCIGMASNIHVLARKR